ncbi:uncharacterized protein LOC132757226, partial [Ruditapes philippinarum]|uniref:uncharacterized protein LOC132757226 n=1 Tax=Ruditapes philippinarum TaxID=129788 RepID=UPI00295C060C
MDNLNQTNVNEALHNVIRKTEVINALALLIKHNLDVNTLQEGHSPSFIAALKGNIDQLLCLLNNGANVSFVTESNYAVDSFDIVNKIKDIKQSRYYGYGLLHIAAKHGHEKIVSKLLEYNKEMIYWKTSLGQRPSDIACEMGNLNVLQKFSNLDNDMLSDCIYYAARSGNENIIMSLTKRKINLRCISNEQSRDAIKEMEVKNLENVEIKRDFRIERHLSYHIVYPLDKWWIVAKETPIHAAIRSGSTEVAKRLIKLFPGLLDCTDSFGYTATLLSVVKNQFDLLPLLTDHILTDRCDSYYFDKNQVMGDGLLHFQEISIGTILAMVDFSNNIIEHFCESGSTFIHLSLKYRRENFINYAIQEKIVTDWNSADEEGIYPIHIAARDANIEVIDFAIKYLRLDISSIKCKNGSTAYHIAAITPSPQSLSRLTDKFAIVIPDIKDINERGFLHHTCLFDQHSQRYSLNHVNVMNFQTSSLLCFQYFVILCNINMKSTDVFGRNILHYALVNGHFSIIEYITINYPLEFRKLLNQKDVNAKTSVQYALAEVNAIRETQNEVVVMAHFSLQSHLTFLNQYKSCLSKEPPCIILKKAWEISLMFTIRELRWEEFQTVIEPFLYLFLIKSGNVFNFIWTFHTQITDEVLGAHIIKSMDENIQPSADTLKEIAWYRPTVFNKCGLPFKRSPLHYIALKGRCVLIDNVLLQLHIEEKYNNSSTNVFNCADENGRFAFHYTVMKGELEKALRQLNHMWNVSNEMIVDAILITILHAHKSYEVCWSKNIFWNLGKENDDELKNDMLLSDAVGKYKDILQITDFCKNNSKRLSVVHLLSVSVMKNTIKTLVEIYGRDILNCMTTDRITPMYLLKLFSPEEHGEIIDESLEILQPNIYAEKYIMSIILSSLVNMGCSFISVGSLIVLILTSIFANMKAISGTSSTIQNKELKTISTISQTNVVTTEPVSGVTDDHYIDINHTTPTPYVDSINTNLLQTLNCSVSGKNAEGENCSNNITKSSNKTIVTYRDFKEYTYYKALTNAFPYAPNIPGMITNLLTIIVAANIKPRHTSEMYMITLGVADLSTVVTRCAYQSWSANSDISLAGCTVPQYIVH